MPTPGKVPTVVVVEDDASLRQALERILRAGGFSAVAYDSAEAALSADAAAADCLILDIHLPGMSGFEMHRQMTRFGGRPRTIFITAHDEPAVREEVARNGATKYLTKPFSGRSLLDAVARVLNPA